MVFPYFHDLSPRDQRIYLQADAIPSIRLPYPRQIYRQVTELQMALLTERRSDVERATRNLLRSILKQLGVRSVAVSVLNDRPSHDYGELHGLYERCLETRSWPKITVWMRTAKRGRVVAFKTFLRTVLHELVHHLDYELLGLADSFHTDGFFKRESSLFHQIKGGIREL